jgi:hypothetical protein
MTSLPPLEPSQPRQIAVMGHSATNLSAVDFRTLVTAAALAPSGDNTQPWRISVDESRKALNTQVDSARDRSPMNAGDRMARIAVGAAAENVFQTAGANALTCSAKSNQDGLVIDLKRQAVTPSELVIPPKVMNRKTNRQAYDGSCLPAESLEALKSSAMPLEGTRIHWLVERPRVLEAASIVAQGDALLFAIPEMLRAFLANVRFDLPRGAPCLEGLSLESLEANRIDRLGLSLLRRIPDWMLRLGGPARAIAKKSRQLVTSASGLAFVTALEQDHAADYAVGRTMQRAWLELATRGYSAQPMMSLPVLENWLEQGAKPRGHAALRERIARLLARLATLSEAPHDGRIGFILRFGIGMEPTGRTSRLPAG